MGELKEAEERAEIFRTNQVTNYDEVAERVNAAQIERENAELRKDKVANKIDTIYKHPRIGYFYDQNDNLLEIWQVFESKGIYCFYSREDDLIIAEWNVNRACFFVIGLYKLEPKKITMRKHNDLSTTK